MRNRKEEALAPTAPAAPAANAFAADYLELLAQQDEPRTAAEADLAGPWQIEQMEDRNWAVLRPGESLARGDVPFGIFDELPMAQVFAAILPGIGREPRYVLGKEQEDGVFPLCYLGEKVGSMREFNEDAVAALNLADALMTSPNEFAWLLAAAGGVALEHTGRISLERVRWAEAAKER
jgi:hypothetical protein